MPWFYNKPSPMGRAQSDFLVERTEAASQIKPHTSNAMPKFDSSTAPIKWFNLKAMPETKRAIPNKRVDIGLRCFTPGR